MIHQDMSFAVYEPICSQIAFYLHNHFIHSFPKREWEKIISCMMINNPVSFWQGQKRSKNVPGLPGES